MHCKEHPLHYYMVYICNGKQLTVTNINKRLFEKKWESFYWTYTITKYTHSKYLCTESSVRTFRKNCRSLERLHIKILKKTQFAIFKQPCLYIYIYIYIYVCVCVCVCVCVYIYIYIYGMNRPRIEYIYICVCVCVCVWVCVCVCLCVCVCVCVCTINKSRKFILEIESKTT